MGSIPPSTVVSSAYPRARRTCLRSLFEDTGGSQEELLEADDLRALGGGVACRFLMLVDHLRLIAGPAGLQQRGLTVVDIASLSCSFALVSQSRTLTERLL